MKGLSLLVALLVIAAVVLFTLPPIAQDVAYHQFADQRTLLAVPHFANVVSNVPFLLVGVPGCWLLFRGRLVVQPSERPAYFCFFLGVGLTAFGSAYYHLDPNNARLFWDRLPMTLAFMGLFGGVLSERAGPRVGAWALPALVGAGIGSSLYWHWTDDLRPYLLLQFYPLATIPLLVLLFPSRYSGSGYLFLALGCYVAAKICELHWWDATLFELTGVSGHTFKHLLAALASYCILLMLQTRHPLAPASGRGSLVANRSE
jgi:hypothetical protein